MRKRRWSLILGLTTILMTAGVLSSACALHPEAPLFHFVAATNADHGDTFLRAGDAAVRDQDYHRADRSYRSAWQDERTRALAADRLQKLHSLTEFAPPVNSSQLQNTLDLLGPTFSTHETAHFVLLSDAPRSSVLGRADLLERAYMQFFRVMQRLEYPATPAEHKMLCIFFANHADYTEFARARDGVEADWIAGYYAGVANRIVFYDDSTGPAFVAAFSELNRYQETVRETRQEVRQTRRDPDHARLLAAHADDLQRRVDSERTRLESEARLAADAKTIHEAIHLLAFNCAVQSRTHEYPFWLTEGLASAFETDRPHAAFGPDRPTPGRELEYQGMLEQGRLLPLASLVTLPHVPEDDPLIADVMYAQSYAVFAYLFRYHRGALGEYLEDLHDSPAGPSNDRRRLELFERHFGDVTSLEARMLKRTGAR